MMIADVFQRQLVRRAAVEGAEAGGRAAAARRP